MRPIAFERKKSGPPVPPPAAARDVAAEEVPDDEAPAGEAAVCPECGCCFDDASGDVIPEGDPRYPKKDAGASDSDADDGAEEMP